MLQKYIQYYQINGKEYYTVKRFILCFFCILSFVSLFVSCNRRQQYGPSNENDTITTSGGNSFETVTGSMGSEESETIGTNNPINKRPYGDIEADEILSLYNTYQNIYVEANESVINTPYYLIISSKNGGTAYSKILGEIVPLCKDAICNHHNCLFGNNTKIVDYVVSEDRIYLLLNSFYKFEMYSFDFWMNDIKKVADWEIEDSPTCLHYYEGQIYYQAFYLHDGEPVMTTFKLNTKNGDRTLLWGTERFNAIVGGYENKIYYKSQGSIYCYDLLTKKDDCVVSASVLDAKKGEITLSFRWASDKVVSYSTYSTIYGAQNYEYNLETDDYIMCIKQNDAEHSNVIRLGDYFYFILRHDTLAYKDNEHYDYFIKQSEELYGKANPSGGEIWRCPISGGDSELVAAMTSNGIPDNIQHLYTYDGKYLVVKYEAYIDYQNEYNPNFDPFSPDYVQCFRFALIDVESGDVFTFETKEIY